jgi:UDP-N-acetylglucosamine 2-epimerase (non-hydrolysing)
LGLKSKQYIVVTIHRASNTDIQENLENISHVLIQIAETSETLVFPIHPRTQKLLANYGLLDNLKAKVKIISPLGYFEFLKLLNHSKKVLTDSGGIKRSLYSKIPCIT